MTTETQHLPTDALPDERAAFEARFPVPGGVSWSGSRYVVKDDYINSYRCDRFIGQWAAWQARASRGQAPAQPAPIDMVLHCPACGLQHIDAPDAWRPGSDPLWDNPPHRSHLCHGCGHIWRPADVPTNGMEAVKTRGKADSPMAARAPADSVLVRFPVKDEI